MTNDRHLKEFEEEITRIEEKIEKLSPKHINNPCKYLAAYIFNTVCHLMDYLYLSSLLLARILPKKLIDFYLVQALLGGLLLAGLLLLALTFNLFINLVFFITLFTLGLCFIGKVIDLYNAFLDKNFINQEDKWEYASLKKEIFSIHRKIRNYEQIIESQSKVNILELLKEPLHDQESNLRAEIEKLQINKKLSRWIELDRFKESYSSILISLFESLNKKITSEIKSEFTRRLHSPENRNQLMSFRSLKDFKRQRAEDFELLRHLSDLTKELIHQNNEDISIIMSFKKYFFELLIHKDSPLTPPKFSFEITDEVAGGECLLFETSEESILKIKERYNPLEIQDQIRHACTLLKQEAQEDTDADLSKNDLNVDLIRAHLSLHPEAFNTDPPTTEGGYFNLEFYQILRKSRILYLNDYKERNPILISQDFLEHHFEDKQDISP